MAPNGEILAFAGTKDDSCSCSEGGVDRIEMTATTIFQLHNGKKTE